ALAVVTLIDTAPRVRHARVRETRELGQCNDLRLAHLQMRRTDVVVLDYMRVGRNGLVADPLCPVVDLVGLGVHDACASAKHECHGALDDHCCDWLPDPVQGQHTLKFHPVHAALPSGWW